MPDWSTSDTTGQDPKNNPHQVIRNCKSDVLSENNFENIDDSKFISSGFNNLKCSISCSKA